MKLAIVCVSVSIMLPSVSRGGPLNKSRDIVPVQSQNERDPLSFYQGTWVVSAEFAQTGGHTYYHFSDDKLTITNYSAEREKDGTRIPPDVSKTNYRVQVSKRGNYLKLTTLPERKVSRELIYRVEYQDGNLELFERDSKFWSRQLRRVKAKKKKK